MWKYAAFFACLIISLKVYWSHAVNGSRSDATAAAEAARVAGHSPGFQQRLVIRKATGRAGDRQNRATTRPVIEVTGAGAAGDR